MMAFDATYLLRRLCQVTMHGATGLIGGIWAADETDASLKKLQDDFNIRDVPKASSILEFLCWDMSARRKACLSACALPVQTNFAGVRGTHRGSWYILNVVGTVLATPGSECIKGVVFDAATTHGLVRKAFFGCIHDFDETELRATPFFGELRYQDLPQHDLPRLPVKLARYKQEIVWGIPGVCFLAVPIGRSLVLVASLLA